MKEIRRRTNVVGSFSDGYSALMLVCSRLRHITTHSWGVRRYINMNLLSESCGNDSEADIAITVFDQDKMCTRSLTVSNRLTR